MRDLGTVPLMAEAASLRPRAGSGTVVYATKVALQTLGRRAVSLDAEAARIDELLGELVADTAPTLLDVFGVGVDTASTLLVAAGDNPERLRSEAAWAHLCGVAPIPASSGKVIRHRLNRGGNRQANSALWRIVMVRMIHDPVTRAYVERRSKEGRSKLEIIRILKRYVAREIYGHLPRG
jgi:transposase